MVKEVPTLSVTAESIPEAHYKAITEVWNNGMRKRTQYDRIDKETGKHLDPPSRDARVLIHVADPFKEPRFPAMSNCERGKYILEMMGAKDHRVLTPEEIRAGVAENALDSRWPYTYPQRIFEWPAEGEFINQVDNSIDRLVQSLDTRRAVITTRCPPLDTLLKEDIPCLGEIHWRALENGEEVILDMTTIWRSRDLLKAWGDNVLAMTYFGRRFAERLGKRIGHPTRLGAYTDFSNSLHIYGQDFASVEGNEEQGKKSFFEVNPTVQDYLRKSLPSNMARELEVLGQMKAMRDEKTWNFPPERLRIIDEEIAKIEGGQNP
jgi:thymidylate synthase